MEENTEIKDENKGGQTGQIVQTDQVKSQVEDIESQVDQISVGTLVNKDQETHLIHLEERKMISEDHHNGGKMRVKCVKCGIIDDLKEDDIKLLAHIVKRYNQKANPVDYVAVLSIIKGFCTDGDKHLFVFDESFEKNVAETIREFNEATKQNVERRISLDKVCIQIEETSNVLKELEKNKEYILAEMAAGGILVDNVKLKFLKLTGTEDMDIWK